MLKTSVNKGYYLAAKPTWTSQIRLISLSRQLDNNKEIYGMDTEKNKRINDKKIAYLKTNPFGEIIRKSVLKLPSAIKKNLSEVYEGFKTPAKVVINHGDYEYLFKFNTKEDLDKWQVSSDAGYELGHSKAKFTLTKYNTGLFHGYLTSEVNKGEKSRAMYSGYTNVTSLPNYSTFGSILRYNLSGFNCFYLKVRGDGRTYTMNLSTSEKYTETLHRMYFTPLYTRGGPYWQYVKIPFSKFIAGNRGRVIDRQRRFLDNEVKRFGFTCMDNNEGPFSLEIDFIALLCDSVDKEQCAYEAYKVPKYIADV